MSPTRSRLTRYRVRIPIERFSIPNDINVVMSKEISAQLRGDQREYVKIQLRSRFCYEMQRQFDALFEDDWIEESGVDW